MNILIGLLIIIVIGLLIWVAMRRSKRKRALTMLQATSQRNVSSAMVSVAAMLMAKKMIQPGQPEATPKLVADIWGRGYWLLNFHLAKRYYKKIS